MNIYVLFIKVDNDKYNIHTSFNNIYYILEDAINDGIIELKNICLDYYNAEAVSINRLKKFYNKKDIYYDFTISVISPKRVRFNSSKELMNYFNNNIKNISNNEELYNFLLTLVQYDNRYYDYNAKLKGCEPVPQYPEQSLGCVVDFSYESCIRRGYYKFDYTCKD